MLEFGLVLVGWLFPGFLFILWFLGECGGWILPIGKSFGVMIGGSTGCSRKICFSEYQNLRLKMRKGLKVMD